MSAPQRLSSFKAYDIRGRIPSELNRELVVAIARAYAAWLKPKRVAVGYDVRLTSPDFAAAVREGLTASGVDVVDIGRCGTEQVYFATFHLKLDGGIMVTAALVGIAIGAFIVYRKKRAETTGPDRGTDHVRLGI